MCNRLLFSFALILPSLGLISQAFTIEGLALDTIYNAVYNKIELNGIECNRFKYNVQPRAYIKLDGCNLSINPYYADTTYQLTIQPEGKEKFEIKLYSERITLEILSIANNFISLEVESIPVQTAKQLRGVKPVINCPWLRDACIIFGYNFRIERNGEIIYIEDILGWQLSTQSKSVLQTINKGTTVIFDDIKWKCPGDDANGQKDIEFKIE